MISVIVPVYNSERWLDRCLNSILNQTYGELEIILVDDGSTDGSPLICDEYAAKDGRIRVIHQQNGGALNARLSALIIATGEWVSFIDSDDWIEVNMYESMLSISDGTAEILWCGVMMERANNVKDEFQIQFKNSCDYLIRSLLRGTIPGWMCNKLIKRSLLLSDTIDMSNAHTMYEDVYWSLQLFLEKPNIKYLDLPLYHYNVANENAATAASVAEIMDKAKYNIGLVQILLENRNLMRIYQSDFSVLAMRCKISELSTKSLSDAKAIFPSAHRFVGSYPISSKLVRYLYWSWFNLGVFGEVLYRLTRKLKH